MNEGIPQPKYSKERYDDLFKKYSESPLFFSESAMAFAKYLREKYPDFQNYAFYHILGGSGIDEKIEAILYEDFPDGDSVEEFIDKIAQ